MPPPQTTDGVVLRIVDYSETSQVVSFWTRDAGRLTGIAKGAKRPKTSFHGPFDLFGLYRIVYREKPVGQLHLLTAADLLDPHVGLRTDPLRFAAAGYGAELLLGLTAEGMPIRPLFDLWVDTLRGLSSSAPIPEPSSLPPSWEPTLFRFETQTLTFLGHRPRVSACTACGILLLPPRPGEPSPPQEGPIAFSPKSGGAVCGRCSRAEGASLRVRTETLRLLDLLAEPGSPVPHPPPPAPIRQELRAVLRSLYTFLLERPPAALGLLP